MVIIFLALAVVVGLVLYLGFLRQTSLIAKSIFAPLPRLPINLENVVTEAELQILDDPRFEVLNDPLGLPVGIGKGGRTNPFAPLP